MTRSTTVGQLHTVTPWGYYVLARAVDQADMILVTGCDVPTELLCRMRLAERTPQEATRLIERLDARVPAVAASLNPDNQAMVHRMLGGHRPGDGYLYERMQAMPYEAANGREVSGGTAYTVLYQGSGQPYAVGLPPPAGHPHRRLCDGPYVVGTFYGAEAAASALLVAAGVRHQRRLPTSGLASFTVATTTQDDVPLPQLFGAACITYPD